MTAKYYQEGDTVDFTPTVDINAGTIVQAGGYIGVADNDIAANKVGGIRVTGVYKFPADVPVEGAAFTLGATVGVNVAGQTATTPGGGVRDLPVAQDKPAGQKFVILQLNNNV